MWGLFKMMKKVKKMEIIKKIKKIKKMIHNEIFLINKMKNIFFIIFK